MPFSFRLAIAALAVTAALACGSTAGVSLAAEGGHRERNPKQGTGLPLPRFVTLRSGEVNLRTGPSTTYPIEWTFVRKEMPVEIIQEFDTWRRIRDWEGAEGWVHQSMLSGRRGVIVSGETRVLRSDPNPNAGVVARAQPGVMGALHKCQGDWCQVDLKGYKGWLMRGEFWGVYPNEKVE